MSATGQAAGSVSEHRQLGTQTVEWSNVVCLIMYVLYAVVRFVRFYLILYITYSYCCVCSVLGIVFHCVVLCIVCVQMCTVLLPPGVNPTAVNKYININIIINYNCTQK